MDMVRLVNDQQRERGVRRPTKRLADDNDAVLEVDGDAPKSVVERREEHEEPRLDQTGGGLRVEALREAHEEPLRHVKAERQVPCGERGRAARLFVEHLG